ncbi:4Fe-4S dicluster domain-containing protein [Pseudomonas sp. 273]|uniref:4Fe-4S dicluster domain-containing protein n=1 Tax=Pseudomonas sp. 273 TaxID=75692 RepID=UPI0023D7C551|nr:4Fe-4S dicluster domain-containing protein [Pseudomonas sp. 273]
MSRELRRLRRQLAERGEAWPWAWLEALGEPSAEPLPEVPEGLDRRRFLQLMGASLALAGLGACGEPPDEAVARVEQEPLRSPGQASDYATAVPFAGIAQPVLGHCIDGRPLKLEGNPEHPCCGGASDAFTQAAILQLYDPDRSQVPRHLGRESGWAQVQGELFALQRRHDRDRGAGLHLVLGASSSPTLARQLQALRQRWPRACFYQGDAYGERNAADGLYQAFGQPLTARLRLENVQALVCLDADLLGPGPRQTAWQRGWAQRRRAAAAGQGQARIHVAEGVPSLTGAAACARLPAAPWQLPHLALALARALGEALPGSPQLDEAQRRWAVQAAAALRGAGREALVCVGAQQPAQLQALAARLNQRLGGLGHSHDYIAPLLLEDSPAAPWEPLAALLPRIADGAVDSLLLLDCNPLHACAEGEQLRQAMQDVPWRLHAGLVHDESAAECHWHLPLSHPLESWSDARAADGSACLVQPLVRPLYATPGLHQLLEMLLNGARGDGHALLRQTWAEHDLPAWRAALERGWIESAPPAATPGQAALPALVLPAAANLVASVRPDPAVWDGRLANLGWLQELPRPISSLTWGNVIGVAPRLAERYGLANGECLRVEIDGQRLEGPVWIEPGQADGLLALTAGYGRQRAGRLGNGVGFAVRALPAGVPAQAVSRCEATGERMPLAITQAQHRLPEGAAPALRRVSRAEPPAAPALLPTRSGEGPQWAMLIDLDLCTGCNACVVACQAENNIPVVGAEQVAAGRAMHWLRIDHYYQGDAEAPRSAFQPRPCMHCERAPCEAGCPVEATLHGSDGLNQMVYNRCIGTRTCAAYCPYKVRRFNWYDWTAGAPPSLQAQRNPEVSVRGRGVMEKCTYCVQRIGAARLAAREQGLDWQAGEGSEAVRTACQQACPSQAIAFGNLQRSDGEPARGRRSPRHYALLEELDTRPRTTYLARIDDEPGAPGDGR